MYKFRRGLGFAIRAQVVFHYGYERLTSDQIPELLNRINDLV